MAKQDCGCADIETCSTCGPVDRGDSFTVGHSQGLAGSDFNPNTIRRAVERFETLKLGEPAWKVRLEALQEKQKLTEGERIEVTLLLQRKWNHT